MGGQAEGKLAVRLESYGRGKLHGRQLRVFAGHQGKTAETGELLLIQAGIAIIHAQSGNAVGRQTETPEGQGFGDRGGQADGRDGINVVGAVRLEGIAAERYFAVHLRGEEGPGKIEFRSRAIGSEAHGGRVGKHGADGILGRGDAHTAHGPGGRSDAD